MRHPAQNFRGAGRGEPSLAHAAFGQLRADIIGGRLPPDRKLALQELCEAYGFGMSPVREALSQLVADRLVRLEPQRGFWVAPVSAAEFRDIAEVRVRLETAAVADAVRRGDEDWEAALLAAEHRLARVAPGAPGAAPTDAWEARHRAFHLALVAACGSPWLTHLLGLLHDQFDRYRRVAGLVASRTNGLEVGHRELVRAALRRAPEEARDLLERHVRQTAELVLGALPEAKTTAPGAARA